MDTKTPGWLGESILNAQAEVATWDPGMRPEGFVSTSDEGLRRALVLLDQRRRAVEGEIALRAEFGGVVA